MHISQYKAVHACFPLLQVHSSAAGTCEGGQAQVDQVIFLVFCPASYFMGIPQSWNNQEELDKAGLVPPSQGSPVSFCPWMGTVENAER